MKVYPDFQLIKKLTELKEAEFDSVQFFLNWPSLLSYLDFGSLFENYPKMDPSNKIFSTIIEILKMDSDKEVIVYLYDQIFVECLTQVKMLSQIQPQVLLGRIHAKRLDAKFLQYGKPFSLALDDYEKKILENPQETMHDLVLYLAWDRVCVYLGAVFDEPSLKIGSGLDILRECLIESFQHITEHGKTKPSFFRLVEALYAYQMKDEMLQGYEEKEWQVLSQGATALQPRDYLHDVGYLDLDSMNDSQMVKVMTFEDVNQVKVRLSLCRLMIEKLKVQISNWTYTLPSYEIMTIKERDNKLYIDQVVCIN